MRNVSIGLAALALVTLASPASGTTVSPSPGGLDGFADLALGEECAGVAERLTFDDYMVRFQHADAETLRAIFGESAVQNSGMTKMACGNFCGCLGCVKIPLTTYPLCLGCGTCCGDLGAACTCNGPRIWDFNCECTEIRQAE